MSNGIVAAIVISFVVDGVIGSLAEVFYIFNWLLGPWLSWGLR